jgi:hypothetical protein
MSEHRSIHYSGFARKTNDFYATPDWVTEALLRHRPPMMLTSRAVLLRHAGNLVIAAVVCGQLPFLLDQ